MAFLAVGASDRLGQVVLRGQVLVGNLAAGISAYAAVTFLTLYFETRTLTQFGSDCLIAGFVGLIWLGVT